MSDWRRTFVVVIGVASVLMCVTLLVHNGGISSLTKKQLDKIERNCRETDSYYDNWLKAVRSDYNHSVSKLLTFIAPGAGLCGEFLKKSGKEIERDLKEYDIELVDHEKEYQKYNKEYGVEGYAAQVRVELAVQWYLAQLPFVHTICETGFNGGHSALLWLIANKAGRLFSFDIGSHKYSKPMAKRIQEKFGERIQIVWGDSTETIPAFIKANPELKCDLVIIDGGHSYNVALADFNNFRNMVNPKHIVFIDDHPTLSTRFGKPIGQMWEERKLNGEVIEMGRCTEKHLRGFSFGMYMF